MMLHVRCEFKRNERQENLGLRGGSVELCLNGGLLDVHPKSHNVPHRLGMRRVMSR